jgi:hypothetical protein
MRGVQPGSGFHGVVKLRPFVAVTFCVINPEAIQGKPDMTPIDLIVTVCAVLSPTTCEETHLVFSSNVSLKQCVMAAQPYIAQWVGEHPKWTAVKWRCEYPRNNQKAFGEPVWTAT